MNNHPQPDTAPVTTNLADAAALLRRLGITEAAVLRASLPESLAFVKPVRVDDLATLKRQANATGAVIATGAEAAEVSRLVAQLRRRAALLRLLPSARAEDRPNPDAGEEAQALHLDIDEALRAEGKSPAEAEAAAPAAAGTSPNDAPGASQALHLDIDEALRAEGKSPAEAEAAAPAATGTSPNDIPGAAQPLHLDIDEALRAEEKSPVEAEAAAPAATGTSPNDAPGTAQALHMDIDEALRAEGKSPAEAADASEPPTNPATDAAESPDKAAESSPVPAESSEKAAAMPAEKQAGDAAEPLFVVLIDSLAEVPALADLPGAQPVLVAVGPIAAEADEVADALRRAYACATDTLWEKHADGPIAAKAKYVLSQSRALLAQGGGDAVQAAALLLERGHEGGYAFLLGTALSRRYGLALGEAMALALPGLQQAMEGTAAEGARLPQLRLRDVPALAEAARRPRRAMARVLTEEELAQALRCLYVPMAGPVQAEALLPRQRAFFAGGETVAVAFRQAQLAALARWVDGHEADIEAALQADLGKCAFEAYETEILLVKEELRCARRNLGRWQRDRRVPTPLMHWPAACRVVRNPYGCALIMAPWNYPFLLSVDPLIAALAAGNCAVLKPSAYAPATSRLLREMASALFDPEYVAVVEGGRAENQSLLAQPFDVIFFTGSVAVGKTVMRAAAEHLTPVTLELGGKSPCIVDDTADVALAARRIAWGKLINAGQTCVAPDYVVCSPAMAPRLEKELARAIRRMYGQTPLNNPELCRIVNQRHYQRLMGLLEGADIALGGRGDSATLKIEPTVVRNVTWDDPLMQEEIFGPILPVVPWAGDFDGLLRAIEARPRPLAAYLFTRDKAHEAAFLRRLRFGGGCVNDVVCHLATSRMPFGGVGESGMGSYHGRRGFEAFSHEKSILKKSRRVDVPVRYAPYGEKKIRLLRRL